jgi:signal transduction histidine kinase
VSALLEISLLATRLNDANEALPRILKIIQADLGPRSGAIALLNPDTGQLETEAQIGMLPNDGLTFSPGQGIPGWAAFHGKAVLVADVTTDSRYRLIRPAVRCQMAVPLRIGDAPAIGVMSIERDETYAYAEPDLARFQELADEAGRVLGRLWEVGHLRGKARQLETLLTAGQSLVGKLEEQELFDTLTRDARQLIQGRAAALYLYNAEKHTLALGSITSLSVAAPPGGDLPVSACLVASALHTQKPVAFANIQSADYLDLIDVPRDPALRSMLAVPLSYEGESLGVLAVFLDRIHRFDNDEKRLCGALASLGAVAWQNARLYARVFRSEESLRKNERLTTLGLLAAEIAHEIRNPLTVLKLLHGGLGLDFAEGDPRRTDMRVIAEKLDQLEAIVTRVLSFGQSPGLHTRVALDEIVQDTLVLLRLKLAQSKIDARFEPWGGPLMLDVHKGQLHQALLNLLLNAMHAMPDGGEIVLRASSGMRGDHLVALLDIADTGGGVPEAIKSRIFDSFLSGRPGGTGLGLAIVKRVVQSHHGDIELLSSSAAGTTFRITLPLARN